MPKMDFDGKEEEEITFSWIFAVLWRFRKLIFIGTVGVTVLSLIISLILPKIFKSDGFFQLGYPREKAIEKSRSQSPNDDSFIGMPIPFYKSASTLFYNPNRFYSFALKQKNIDDEYLKKIASNFRFQTDISKWIKPVYAYAKDDVRELVQLPQDESNLVIGLALSFEADSPKNALFIVSYFGEYIRDCLLYFALSNYILDGYNNILSKSSKIENEIIGKQFEITQNSKKMLDIRAIITNYPESSMIENRQLVSVQEGGERFLAPVTQLVGIESTLAELRRQLARLEWEKEKYIILKEFFSRCNEKIEGSGESGNSILKLLNTVKEEVFKDKDLNKDTVNEVFNNLNIASQRFELAFISSCRFISGPTLPSTNYKPRKSLIVISSCFFSFVFFVGSAFIINWWQKYRPDIIY